MWFIHQTSIFSHKQLRVHQLAMVPPLLIAFLLSVTHCVGGTFVGETLISFRVTQSDASGHLVSVPAELLVSTDYNTLNWTVSWDVIDAGVEWEYPWSDIDWPSDWPDPNWPDIERVTSVSTRGTATLSEPLTLADSFRPSSAFGGSSHGIYFDASFSGASQFSDRTETWEAVANDVYAAGNVAIGLQTRDYPSSVALSVKQSIPSIHVESVTTGGKSITLEGLQVGVPALGRDLFAMLTEVIPGDFNSDGRVDAIDYTVARDANSRVVVALTDLATWRKSYGTSTPQNLAEVPEPLTAALFAVLLAFSGSRLPSQVGCR